MTNLQIPFNKPFLIGAEIENISKCLGLGSLSGNGEFTKSCEVWLKDFMGSHEVLITNSCTASLEMSSLLLNVEPGDEIIMPSYTFVSTANAFVLHGGIPIFIDIKESTLNIDEDKIEQFITNRTKAIVVVHYAGQACNMEKILHIANKYNISVVEDSAQGLLSFYNDKPLGSIGDIGCISFHDTKNIICGEGGALIINNQKYANLARVIHEKGTNRDHFLKKLVSKYSWIEKGSSFMPAEIVSAFLYTQLTNSFEITQKRVNAFNYYLTLLGNESYKKYFSIPEVPPFSKHNAHIFYVILNDYFDRDLIINELKKFGIYTTSHYEPLHSSPFGSKFRNPDQYVVTDKVSKKILRLPIWNGITKELQERVATSLLQVITTKF